MRLRFLLITLIIVLALSKPTQTQSNRLQSIAASMTPGTFALLDRAGDASGYGTALLHDSPGTGGITGYADKMAYDPVTDRVYFSGGEHSGLTRTIHYNIATDRWFNDGLITVGIFGHAYDTNALVPSARMLFANSKLPPDVRIYNIDSNTYTQPAQPPAYAPSTEPSMEYFPDRDQLLWTQGGRAGGVAAYNRTANTWSTVIPVGTMQGLEYRGVIMRYSPVDHCVYIMGGVNTDPVYPQPDIQGRGLYKYDQNGAVTRLADLPPSVWAYTNHYMAWVDPVSGEIILINAVLVGNWVYESGNPLPFTGQNQMWRYTPSTNVWTQMNINILPDPTQWWQPTDTSTSTGSGAWMFSVTSVSLPTYGVSLVLSTVFEYIGRESRVYIYKHSASTPPPNDTTPPNVIMTAPTTGSTVSAAVTIAATATDNIAVLGVQFKLDGANLQPEDTTAPYSIIWDSTTATNGLHSLTATARDAAGNTATSSAVSVTVNNVITPPPSGGTQTYAEKCLTTGVIGCFGFDSAANVRNFPVASAYPLAYGWGDAVCNTAGLGVNHPLTRNRASNELNTAAYGQGSTCYFPTIDTSVAASGAGSFRIEVPAVSDQRVGGFFDTTFQGLDRTPIRIGPDNGGEIYHQYRYRTQNMAQNTFNGAFPNSLTKMILFCSVPPGLDFCGSDNTLASVFGYSSGWMGPRDGLYQSYTRDNQNNIAVSERTINGTIYLQTGVLCPYNFGGSYSYPPCVRLLDGQWTELTQHFKLNPVANNFTVSGTTLSRANTFNSNMSGRYVYIVGDNYYRIASVIDANSVTLASTPLAGTNKTVYISGYPNSTLQEWVDGVLIMNNVDQIMAWDISPAGWGEFRLLPHQTARNISITATPGTVWYDDFIVSTQPITFGTAAAASANTYYVSTTGSDTNLCPAAKTVTTPKRNFNGANGALACLISGDTLLARSGTYAEFINASAIAAGVSGAPTTVSNFPGETVTLRPPDTANNILCFDSVSSCGSTSYVVFNGITLDGINGTTNIVNGLKIDGTNHHITFQNGEIKNLRAAGADLGLGNGIGGHLIYNTYFHDVATQDRMPYSHPIYNAAANSIFDKNTIDGGSRGDSYGIQIYDGGVNQASNNIIRNNTIINMLRGGMILSSGTNNVAYNNVINNSAYGISLNYGCSACKVWNNTVVSTAFNGIDIGSQASNTIIQNNIVLNSGAFNYNNLGVATTADHNVCNTITGGCTIAGTVANTFVSPSDFHLSATSPALNQGVTIASFFTDKDGVTRPQGSAWDIGAYERVSTPVTNVVRRRSILAAGVRAGSR